MSEWEWLPVSKFREYVRLNGDREFQQMWTHRTSGTTEWRGVPVVYEERSHKAISNETVEVAPVKSVRKPRIGYAEIECGPLGTYHDNEIEFDYCEITVSGIDYDRWEKHRVVEGYAVGSGGHGVQRVFIPDMALVISSMSTLSCKPKKNAEVVLQVICLTNIPLVFSIYED